MFLPFQAGCQAGHGSHIVSTEESCQNVTGGQDWSYCTGVEQKEPELHRLYCMCLDTHKQNHQNEVYWPCGITLAVNLS